MLGFFRGFMQSRTGIIITFVFLGLIALAFAGADVSGSKGFGGVAGGDRVASVGNRKISTSELSQATRSTFEQSKRDNPSLTMRQFLGMGAINQMVEQLIDRTAMAVFGEKNGILAGKRLVDSEIGKIGAFRGPDGKFNEDVYRQAIAQQGLSDKAVRDDISQGLIAKQLLVPASFGAVAPHELGMRYAGIFKERRIGAVAMIPSATFAPKAPPSDAEVAAYYASNKDRFIRPERRIIRYATFGEAALKTVPAPTDAEIAAAFEANKAQYAASESRRFTQLILPTEAVARAVLADVAKGQTLDAAARAKGLSTAAIGPVGKATLAGQSSAAVADAGFSSARGAVAGPAKSGLGWHLMKVDAVETKAAKTLAQVRPALVSELTEKKRRAAFADLTASIEEEFDGGGNLAEAAKKLGVTVQSTPPLLADGSVYDAPGAKAPPEVARAVQAAFAMESEGSPQLAEIEAGKTFLMFDVGEITTSAAAPLKDIKPAVVAQLAQSKGYAAAKAAADAIIAQMAKGKTLAAAITATGASLPPPQSVNMSREQIAAAQGRVPMPLALMFSMAKGSVKRLDAGNNQGWYVVSLTDITPGVVTPADPLLVSIQRELGTAFGREYADQLRRALRLEVGAQRNEAAIKAVTNQLTGQN